MGKTKTTSKKNLRARKGPRRIVAPKRRPPKDPLATLTQRNAPASVPRPMVADLSNPRHFRRDCRDIVRILQFNGVFSREEIVGLVRQAGTLAAKAAASGNSRGYKRAMDVLLAAAKAEQAEKPQVVEHDHAITFEQRRNRLSRILGRIGSGVVLDQPAGDKAVSGDKPARVEVLESEFFFGNDAHDQAAKTAAASDAAAEQRGPIQGARLRSALGQDSDGADDGAEGARSQRAI